MKILNTFNEQKVLLPKHGDAIYMVLFYRTSEQSPQRTQSLLALSMCQGIAPINNFEMVGVDLDHAPEIAERFALPQVPLLAAVFDGTILCLDDALSESTCRELSELAILQKKSLLEVAS